MQKKNGYHIALQRIQECIEEKAIALDLSNLDLERIPKEIQQCKWIETLDLAANKILKIENLDSFFNLKLLNLGSKLIKEGFRTYSIRNSISKIQGLEAIASLQTLNLSDNPISKIEGLQTLASLQTLNLSDNPISKIEGLQTLASLQTLNLSGNPISKIEGLQTLASLQTLNLSGNQISKIEELQTLASLQTLNLSGNPISKIEGLQTLASLQTLNLSGNQISKIEELQTLASLQTLNLSGNQISKIEGLQTLASLQTLDLSYNPISKIEGLQTLASLQTLNLSYNQISKIEGLQTLASLQTLDLSYNQISKIEGLQTLASLQTLNLSGNQISKIEELQTLASLQTLDLSGNQISKIEGLQTLASLQTLNLSYNQISKIEGLQTLASLQTLNLSYNQISKIEELQTLASLQTLNLIRNPISKIEGLQTLASLQTLDLIRNQISKIEGLQTLASLQTLDLSYNQISKIEGLQTLASLQTLDLIRNQISKIEGLQTLASLQTLDLSYNQISKIEGLQTLASLQTLDLSYNQICTLKWNKYFKPTIQEYCIQLKNVSLHDNPIKEIPAELLIGDFDSSSFKSSCLKHLHTWFSDLESGYEVNHQLKLIFIGNGSAGKTSLVEALKKGRCESDFDSTHGVLIDLLDLYETDKLQFYCWDFGGQEIYHGTHRLFLSTKSIQVIVFDPGFEDQPFVPDRVTNERQRNLKVDYWIRYVKETSPASKIIIVQNKMDVHPQALKRISIDATEKELPFIQLSAVKGNNIDDLRFRLKKLANEFNEYGMPMPKAWYDVREYFLKNVTEANPVRTISLRYFKERCKSLQVRETSIPLLLKYLHDTGIIYYNKMFLADTIIADQRWALQAIYKVLDRSSSFYDLLRNEMKGVCRIKYVFEEFGKDYTREQKELLLEFMQGCGLCFVVRQHERQIISDDTWCIFPEFLSKEMSPTAKSVVESKTDTFINIRKSHTFLHYYTIQQFISLLSPKTDLSLIWKNGIIVNAQTSSFKVEGDFENNIINISIDKNANIEFVRDIIFTIEGRLEENLKGWKTDDEKDFFELYKEKENLNESRANKPVISAAKKIESVEALPTIQQIKPKEIVFSYAKEDLSILEIIRNHLGGLMHDNLITIWYDKNLTNTRDWNDEIRSHFESCDAIIMIGSSNYISPDKKYIWEQEVPIILKRFSNNEVFAIRINASPFYSPQKISSINCYNKQVPIPRDPGEREDYISSFIYEEIAKKLIRID